ncbi:MAG: hypothetical protein K2X73_01550 [Sphingomonas sp.]|uniref:hypothetical protein n=1 Tax=Sphingomonas sp. TaxID=28214 RepID=UPI0025CC235D|nr:hypothetical protein [Sphingomonas sp.]MBX9880636.1 hypothetical protein [Sphingomonas sp.]
MKIPAVAAICAVAVSACSGKASDTLPPLPTIEKATLAYADCVDIAARKLASQMDGVDVLAKRAVDGCRDLREKALALKGVPVIFPTVAEYDATHFGLAKQAIENSRAK